MIPSLRKLRFRTRPLLLQGHLAVGQIQVLWSLKLKQFEDSCFKEKNMKLQI